ncbi:MAG: N-acetyltransferase [Pseudonocardiaceae bacterium]|nr:N-acetyltransferase [Pseudonocardiaceae bacterium]
MTTATTLTSWASFLGRSARDRDLIVHIYRTACERVRSDDEAVGLKRDLTVAHTPPEAAIAITVRPIEDRDVPRILGTDDAGLSAGEKWERARRHRLLETGAGTCYVAVSAEDEPCYLQWLFSERDNAFLQRYFRGSFPVLDGSTALLEDAFTPENFRGKRIMSAAMALIAERGADVGARYVITFVGVDNAASLKGCGRAGFSTYVHRTQRWRLFRQAISFRPAEGPVAAQ